MSNGNPQQPKPGLGAAIFGGLLAVGGAAALAAATRGKKKPGQMNGPKRPCNCGR